VSSVARLDRSEAALHRGEDAETREQDVINREVATSAQKMSAPDEAMTAATLDDMVEGCRRRLVGAAIQLAGALDRVAEHHDHRSDDAPDDAAGDEHRRQADHARATARLARDTVLRFSR
jgi:hypothetical protein